MIDVKLYTHEEVGEIDETNGPELKHTLLELRLPDSVAEETARLFFCNPGADTSVHEDTVKLFGLPSAQRRSAWKAYALAYVLLLVCALAWAVKWGLGLF